MSDELLTLLPFTLVVLLALAVILVDLFWPRRDDLVIALGIGGLGLALVATLAIGPLPWDVGALDGPYAIGDPALYTRDLLTVLLDALLISIGLLTLLFAPDYVVPRKLPLAEFTATLLFAVSGGMLIAGGQDLLVLFIGLELLVLPGYVMAGFAKRDGLSTEGAIKYFLLGSFSSAILLFGLAFVIGFTGSTQVSVVADTLSGALAGTEPLPLALAMALALLAVGLLFKIAAVPFHYWTPDAYQGSPTPVTGYLSVGPKIAAFALILRIFVEALGPLRGEWALLVGILAAITMTVGNLAALGQDNIKRMLAYSSIAHTGYIMVGLAVFATAEDREVAASGVQGVLFYGVAYAFMNLGAFAVVAALQRRPGVTSQIATFGGLGYRAPVLALAMTVFLLSLVGIPPLAGFFAKMTIVLGALEVGGGMSVLAVIMMLNAAMAAFYYLRVVVYMYMRQPAEGAREVSIGTVTRAGLIVAAAMVIVIGLVPPVTGAILEWTEAAAQALISVIEF
ncbi:MAG: NADH-quinone oxidoreductase subunit N [Chloroflexota bacterium]|jgi:NADH-quinone oxidoreductase subunit N